MGLTKDMGRFLATLRYEALPPEAIKTVRLGFTDCVACLVTGWKEPVTRTVARGLGILHDGANVIGNHFYGSDGFMSVDLKGYQIFKGEKRELVKDEKFRESKQWDTAPHMHNFLKAVRSRNHADLNADIEEGHLSAALCHMANISYRTGRKLVFDPATEHFVGDAQANALITRKYRQPYAIA